MFRHLLLVQLAPRWGVVKSWRARRVQEIRSPLQPIMRYSSRKRKLVPLKGVCLITTLAVPSSFYLQPENEHRSHRKANNYQAISVRL